MLNHIYDINLIFPVISFLYKSNAFMIVFTGVKGEIGFQFKPSFLPEMQKYPTSFCSEDCGIGQVCIHDIMGNVRNSVIIDMSKLMGI